MMPAQAIVETIAQVLRNEFFEFRDRVFINRTVALDESEGDLTAITVRQGADDPFDDASTFDRIGMSLSIQVVFTDSDNDEPSLVGRLNELRLRTHRVLMARNALALPWVLSIAARGAEEPATSAAASIISKELVTRWGVLYTMDRTQPDA